MNPQPIINKAMWACYNPSGEIIFGTNAHTKEDSEKLLELYYKVSKAEKSNYLFKMIAIDIVPVDMIIEVGSE